MSSGVGDKEAEHSCFPSVGLWRCCWPRNLSHPGILTMLRLQEGCTDLDFSTSNPVLPLWIPANTDSSITGAMLNEQAVICDEETGNHQHQARRERLS